MPVPRFASWDALNLDLANKCRARRGRRLRRQRHRGAFARDRLVNERVARLEHCRRSLRRMSSLLAVDQAAPLVGWALPDFFEARLGKPGTRECAGVAAARFGSPTSDALTLGVIGFDAVKHLTLCRIEHRPPQLDAVSASAGRARGDDRGGGLPGAAGGGHRVMATSTLLLDAHLKALRLPTFLREYDKVARQCAHEGLDCPRYLFRLCELELLDRGPPSFRS